ncbi:ABC transporter permease [Bacillus sp. ISL-35]|uniref:ABC transporter permease subunit n=1 Tax=Bacillus sp. ISL-35 TaxID=2819122 RepID=UPI001BEA6C98|nr:ABC transporter permease [Bacillus sp. ISL-35]MBT2679660.1 ABC transporter permease [Bacillus sp. ISL-35]MBT2704693.1 ABC transporter permease [Chryseobacterium sp. ISL-80]
MRNILNKIVFFIVVSICLILITLFPREAMVTGEGRAVKVVYTYDFSWEEYMGNIIHFAESFIKNGSFGETRYHKPVEEEVAIYFPRSLKIIVTAFFLSLAAGVLKGIYDFKNSTKRKSILGNWSTWLLLSIPDFLIILLFQWIIIFYVNWIDIFGHEQWFNFFIPSLLAAIYPAMYISRITAGAVSSEAGKQYVQVAKAKGFNENYILYRHILKNCGGTILNYVPTMMIYILSNLLFLEYLLDYKGAAYRLWLALDFEPRIFIGRESFYEPSVIISFGICFMAIVLFAQICSHLLSSRLDPR